MMSLHGWQPIETAPRDGTPFLSYGPHEHKKFYIEVTYMWPIEGGRYTITWMHGYGEPTHWMPLPEPPTGS